MSCWTSTYCPCHTSAPCRTGLASRTNERTHIDKLIGSSFSGTGEENVQIVANHIRIPNFGFDGQRFYGGPTTFDHNGTGVQTPDGTPKRQLDRAIRGCRNFTAAFEIHRRIIHENFFHPQIIDPFVFGTNVQHTIFIRDNACCEFATKSTRRTRWSCSPVHCDLVIVVQTFWAQTRFFVRRYWTMVIDDS